MKYYTSQEVADIMGLTKRSINYMCKDGKFTGAFNDGYRWNIPVSCVREPGSIYNKSGKNGNVDTRPMGVGKQSFESVRVSNCFYIDKTAFIKEWWENQSEITLITRPRRFGKTLNLSMVECFFSNLYENRSELFEGLVIWDNQEYRELQGTYPVIQLSLARVKEASFENAYIAMCQIIRETYMTHAYLETSEFLSENELDMYNQTMSALRNNERNPFVANSLNLLSRLLHRHFGKKTIILLDEYDTPMQEAFVGNYWDEMSIFVRSLFNSTFKSNLHLERAIITGITRTSKESIFSDLNNLDVATVMSDRYATSFGFTEDEVFNAMNLRGVGTATNKDKVKKWYDGFTIGKSKDIYNPWSIVNFLDKGELQNYWVNTSSNTLISQLIQKSNPHIKDSFMILLEWGTVHKRIDDQIVYNQLYSNEESIWNLLLASGYLKASNVTINGRVECDLSITNMEVKTMFDMLVSGWFQDERYGYNGFIKALLSNNLDYMNDYMNEMALSTFSFYDVGSINSEKTEPERFYHGFVLGMSVDLRDRYILRSNRESGIGRYDIMMIPRDISSNLPGIIIEFKVRQVKRENSLEETVKAALDQIEEKKYEQELIEAGLSADRIYKYGFAFEGKTVLIG